MEPTRDGRLSILIKLMQIKLKDSTNSSDGISTDHSTSDQECHSTELLKHMETTMSTSEDISRTRTNKCGSSMELIRLSETTTGRTMPWSSNLMVVDNTSKSQVESTQDGGRCGEMKLHSLSMIKERYLISKVVLILKADIFSPGTSMERLTSNGKLSMLTSIQKNQRRENSMKNLDFMLKDHSTLFLNYQNTDTLTSSTTETWSSRQEMEETLKPGGSTKRP
jgi:hypothetical protein